MAFLLSIGSASALPVFAEDAETIIYNGLTYDIENGDSALIVGVTDKTITSVTIPAEVEGLPVDLYSSENCFSDCSNLEEILVDPENSNFKSVDGVLFTDDLSNLIAYPCARKADVYIVPDTTKIIGEGAFKNCNSLQEITIPETVTLVKMDAFRNGKSLKRFTNPLSSLEHGCAFMGCTSLEELDITKSVWNSNIATIRLEDFQKLETFTLPALGVSEYFTVKNCPELKELILEPSDEQIDSFRVDSCNKLTSLDLSCVNVAEDVRIENCEELKKMQLSNRSYLINNCPNLQDLYFYSVGAKLDEIVIENSESENSLDALADMGVTIHCRRDDVDTQTACEQHGIPCVILEDETTPGDTNGDGETDIRDVIMLNRIVVGVEKSRPSHLLGGDVDGSGKLELADSMSILRKLVGLE